MKSFSFHNPTRLIFGTKTVKEIGSAIKEAGFTKILLIAGGGSIKKNGVYADLCRSFREHQLEWVESWGVQPNPTLTKAEEIRETAKKNKIDCILAAGGGSVIDTAKAVAAGFFTKTIWDIYEGKITPQKALPLFVVLTISATGSEMNPHSVLSNEKEHKKWSMSFPCLYPHTTIVDPSVQRSLPWIQTANGAMDALSHCMESYVTGEGDELTLALSESIMKTVIDATDKLQNNENDTEARCNLALGATLALNGISAMGLGGDWTSHGIEHGISALHPEVAHGSGLAIVFPAWILHVWKEKPAVFLRWATNVWQVRTVEEAVKNMKAKLQQWNLPISLKEIGIQQDAFDAIAENVMQKPRGTVKKLDKQDILSILEKAR